MKNNNKFIIGISAALLLWPITWGAWLWLTTQKYIEQGIGQDIVAFFLTLVLPMGVALLLLREKKPIPSPEKPVDGKNGQNDPPDKQCANMDNQLRADLDLAQSQLETCQKLLQDNENQRIVLTERLEEHQKYFHALEDRYGHLLKKARLTDENNPEDVKILWEILLGLALHQYDYMKKICNDDNWREVQSANIRLILENLKVSDLSESEYIRYSDDPRDVEKHFRILCRLLASIGLEKSEDVLISGVRF